MSDTTNSNAAYPFDFSLDMDDLFPLPDTRPEEVIWYCAGFLCGDEGFYRSDIGEYLCDLHYAALSLTEDYKPKE